MYDNSILHPRNGALVLPKKASTEMKALDKLGIRTIIVATEDQVQKRSVAGSAN